jgi:hypothetical protein
VCRFESCGVQVLRQMRRSMGYANSSECVCRLALLIARIGPTETPNSRYAGGDAPHT